MKCLDHFTDETKHIWFAEKAEYDFLDMEIIKNTTLLHNVEVLNMLPTTYKEKTLQGNMRSLQEKFLKWSVCIG